MSRIKFISEKRFFEMRFWWISVVGWLVALTLWFQEIVVLVLARVETNYTDFKLFTLVFLWIIIVFSFFHVVSYFFYLFLRFSHRLSAFLENFLLAVIVIIRLRQES